MNNESQLFVDQHEIKFAMAGTLLLVALSWVLNSWIPVAIAGICQLVGSTRSSFAPYSVIYKYIILPAKLMKPHVIPDDPAPHQFAALMGGLFTLTGTIFLWLNFQLIGWILLTIVFTFQNINFWVNFCMMLYVYNALNRHGVAGFRQ